MATTKSKSARAAAPGTYALNPNEQLLARQISGLVRTFRAYVIAANKLDPKMEINRNWNGLQMPVPPQQKTAAATAGGSGKSKTRTVGTHALKAGAGAAGSAASSR